MQSSDMQSGSERSETQPSAESFAGVSLVQLAAVAAAKAEGFSLEEALNTEGLEPGAYRAADIAYKSSLVDPAQRERLADDYQNELARAEDRLGRKVSPIDEDVDAWVRFLGTYGTQSAPADWLVTLGLTLPDLSRLSRTWKQRLDADETLRKRAEKSARDKKPYDVASLRVAPAKLVPSPLAKPNEKQPLGDTAPLPVESVPVVKRWMPKAEPIAEMPAFFSAPQNLGMAFDLSVKPVASPLAMTSPVFSLPDEEEVLPFVPGPEIPDEPPTPEEEAAALAPPREPLSGTSLSVDIPRGPATPFAEKPKAIELPKVQPAPAALSGTSLAVDIPRGPAMPFAAASASAAAPEKPKPTELPKVQPAPAALSGTSLAVEIPRGPATPFEAKSGAAREEVAPEPAAPAPPPKEEKPAFKPLLSLEQHAALTVEIATYPAHALAILKRYGLTPPQKVDLDQHYQRIVGSDPAKQAAWHAAYGAHYATLMRAPRR